MTLIDNMPHLCKIERRTFSRGEMGGLLEGTPVLVKENVKCWFQNLDHRETLQFSSRRMKIRRKVFFQDDPGVNEQYQITQTSLDRGETTIPSASRLTLNVLSEALPDAGAGLGQLYKVIVGTTEEETL